MSLDEPGTVARHFAASGRLLLRLSANLLPVCTSGSWHSDAVESTHYACAVAASRTFRTWLVGAIHLTGSGDVRTDVPSLLPASRLVFVFVDQRNVLVVFTSGMPQFTMRSTTYWAPLASRHCRSASPSHRTHRRLRSCKAEPTVLYMYIYIYII